MEITFKDITRIIKKNIVFIAVLSLLCAAAANIRVQTLSACPTPFSVIVFLL